MTERGRTALRRDATTLSIGPSALHWDGTRLTIDIAEVTAPLPSRLRGTVRVTPTAITGRVFNLDQAGHHTWSPIAPMSHVEVELSSPALNWSGTGYLDTNSGDRPLEDDFVQWDWCRAPMEDKAVILYNATRRVGGEQSLALQVGRDGSVQDVPPPPRVKLPATRWRVPRQTRAELGQSIKVTQTLEDTPFYARSVLDTKLLGPSRHGDA